MRRAKSSAGDSHLKAPMQPVGANNATQVWDKEAENRTCCYNFLSFTGTRRTRGGNHPTPTWSEILFAFFMEYVAAMIITMGVGIGSWYQGSSLPINALTIAIFYGGAYFLATRLPSSDNLPRHGHGGLTFGYLFTRDIGLWGWLLYTAAQYLGCMTAGGAFLGPLYSGLQGGAVLGATPTTVVHSLIPVPITTGSASSLTTVILLEILGAATFVFIVIVKHHLNTQAPEGEHNAKGENAKNMRKATKLGALTIFILVLIGYQFQVFTYNNVAWLGPAFGGINGVLATDYTRQINNQVNLYSTIYTDSVFDTTGAAAALYLVGPLAGGALGALLAWAFMLMGFNRRDDEAAAQSDYYNNGPTAKYFHAPLQDAIQQNATGLRSALLDPSTGRPA